MARGRSVDGDVGGTWFSIGIPVQQIRTVEGALQVAVGAAAFSSIFS